METEGIMMHFFDVFNGLFFFGSLEGLCNVDFRPATHEHMKGFMGYTVGRNGSEEGRQTIPDSFAILICLRPLTESDDQLRIPDRSQRFEAHLGTLLHEMLHAFFLHLLLYLWTLFGWVQSHTWVEWAWKWLATGRSCN